MKVLVMNKKKEKRKIHRKVKNILQDLIQKSHLEEHKILIYHSNLGTKHKSHQRLITIRHENGVIVLPNE